MALANDRMGARKESEAAIVSRKLIAAQNAASDALRGLGQELGGDGLSSPWGKWEARPWKGRRACGEWWTVCYRGVKKG